MRRKNYLPADTDQTERPVDALAPESIVPAGIEYVGVSGISKECQDAVLRLLQYGDKITHARILSSSSRHCLLLTVNGGDIIAVKSGFSSGYLGEGPRTFSYVLQVLYAYDVEIEEYTVSKEVIERIDTSSMTKADLEAIDAAEPVQPSNWYNYVLNVHPRRWYDYILDGHLGTNRSGKLWENFPFVIPFAIIDSRITDLAISFWEGPDDRLMTGYRRLEDIVRGRTAIEEHGARLFGQAFHPNDGKLTWKDVDGGERAGRMQLFTGAYTAYRNRRAHREPKGSAAKALMEFLLLNHLFLLEKESTEVNSA